ncbi:MAG TPA: glycosyltransferase family 39 protein [Candidatus Angelobacter sp.]|nr:glycosyltransferase family 39 protein [Candidatus Angelobacter sp.]
MSVRSRLLTLQLAFLLGVCLFLFFFGLGAFGLIGADEPRYAQIAREMFQRHDWIVPTFNGSPWLEKPVLLYWKIINSYAILGVQDWAARLPSAFHATALVVVIFLFIRRFRPGSEMDAALIAGSSAAVIGFARGASTDMSLSADFSMGMMAWWAWHATGKKLWLAAFFVLLAAAALAKGPVAPALALLIVGGYAWLRRDGSILQRSFWLPGFLLFCAVALPWYIAIQVKVPRFFRVFFLEHNLERFGTNIYQHSQPFWYYIPVFILATLPWTAFTLPALIAAVRDEVQRFRTRTTADVAAGVAGQPSPPANLAPADDRLLLFLLLWTLVPIVLFSISRSKLPGYILPSIPAAALLTADYLQRKSAIGRLHLMLHSLICGVLIAGALLTPWLSGLVYPLPCRGWCKLHFLLQVVPDRTKPWIVIISGLIATLVLIVVRRGGRRFLHFATMVPVVLALAFLLRPAALLLDNTLSARIVDLAMRQIGIGKIPLAAFHVKREVAYGLTFYRNQPVSWYEPDGPRDLPSGVPPQEHVVIAREGSDAELTARVAPRTVTRLGDLPQQHLEFFLVSNSK